MNAALRCCLLLLPVACALAQPTVSSVLNNASYALPSTPNSGLARGSLVAIFGTGLAATGSQVATSWPLTANMGGTSVRLTVGATTVDALMVYTTPGQIGAIVPSGTPEGTGTLTVTYNNQTSRPANVRVVRASFGAFARNSQGSGPASVENASQQGRPINALNKSARPGEVAVLWGTGLGPVTGNEAAGPQPGDLASDVEVYVGGRRATVSYKGRSGCCAGIDQIAFVIPEGVEGCYVPVAVKIGDVVSNFTTMSISRSGDVCSDPTLSNADLERALGSGSYRSGFIALARGVIKLDIPGLGSAEVRSDTGSASFSAVDSSQLLIAPGASSGRVTVALGACVVSTFTVRSTPTNPGEVTPVTLPAVRQLDAGPVINVSGPKGPKQLTRLSPGVYSSQLGGGTNIPGLPNVPGLPANQPDYLDAGDYRIDNGGGSSGTDAIGPFQTSIRLPAATAWTNINDVSAVVRSQGQLITWSGGAADGYVGITGVAADANAGTGSAFTCVERASAGRFTIPSYVLLSLPASTGQTDAVSLTYQSDPVRFTASGLDAGYVYGLSQNTKTVTWR